MNNQTSPHIARTLGALALVLAIAVAGCSQVEPQGQSGKRPNAKQSGQATKSQNKKQQGMGSGSGEPSQSEPVAMPKPRARTHARLAKLRVRAETPNGYERDLFYHWKDLGACDVREVVLARQDNKHNPCGSDSGLWVSAYDGVRTSDPGDFDVDHMVPLAEAWASGARSWPEEKRDAFANDLSPYSLIAVSASSNRSKSDQDPAEWMPENESFDCAYLARWIAVKFRWRLSIDPGERAFLRKSVSGCPAKALSLKGQVLPFSRSA